MAKAKKAAEAPAKKSEFKFGVSDLAKLTGTQESSVRVALRNKKVKKAGKSYGWNSKAELEEVAGQLKSDSPKKADKKTAKKEAKKAKPAKKGKAAAKEEEDEGAED